MVIGICVSCQEPLGSWDKQVRVSDGYVCMKCWNKALLGDSVEALASGRQYTGEHIRQMGEAGLDIPEDFKATRKINCVEFDDAAQRLTIRQKGMEACLRYDQLVQAELLEDGESVSSGGLGRALLGGALFGGTGAIVGATTGAKKTRTICSSLKIKLTLRDSPAPAVYIPFIQTNTKTSSVVYQTAYREAQDLLSAVQVIVSQNGPAVHPVQPASTSAADEIRKFKQLCDEGIITEEEFAKKKRELLGI